MMILAMTASRRQARQEATKLLSRSLSFLLYSLKDQCPLARTHLRAANLIQAARMPSLDGRHLHLHLHLGRQRQW